MNLLKKVNKSFCEQRGQALPLGIALVMFCALLTIVLFNSGQLVTQKSRLANTADAAAYSGLVWQARALNFKAYTNRAMVANQVSIAQFVSLASWASYGKITARNINYTIGNIPFLKPYTQAVHSAMNYVDQIVGNIANIAIPVINGVNTVLSGVQHSVYYSTFAITPSIVREVVKENDPNFDVDSSYAIAFLGKNALDWQNFLSNYSDEQGLLRKADIINRSKDRFTSSRGWDIGRFNLGLYRAHLIKEGSTHLVYDDGEWAWRGKDTQSFHEWHYKCSWRGCKWKHRETPIGWGGANGSEDVDCGSDCPSWGRRNRKGQKWATSSAKDYGSYDGVQAYYDLKDLSESNKDPRMVLRIEVQNNKGNIRTAENVGIGSQLDTNTKTDQDGIGVGMFKAEDNFAANSMASISAAELYFERPAYHSSQTLRVNGRAQQEYASLWNPYWQVRLTDVSKEQRLAAWAIRSPEIVQGAASGAVTAGSRYASDQQRELEGLTELQQYAEELVEKLPENISSKDSLMNDLAAVQAQVSNASALAEQRASALSEAKNAVKSVETQLASLVADREQLSQQLDEATSSVEALAIQQQLELVEGQISSTAGQLASANETLDESQESFLAVQDDLNLAVQQEINASNELAQLEAVIGLTEQYQAEAGNVTALISTTEELINSDFSDLAENYLPSDSELADIIATANSIKNNDLSSVQDALIDMGKEKLEQAVEDAVVEQLEKIIKEAAESAIKNAISSYAGDYTSYINYAKNTAQQADQVAANVQEDYIAPLEEKVAEMRAQYEGIRDAMQTELDSAVSIMEQDISYLENQMNMRVSNATSTVQNEINALADKKLGETDPLIQQELQEKIDDLNQKINLDKIDITAQYQAQISEIQTQINSTVAEFEDNIDAAEARILAEIEEVERKIGEMRKQLNTVASYGG